MTFDHVLYYEAKILGTEWGEESCPASLANVSFVSKYEREMALGCPAAPRIVWVL